MSMISLKDAKAGFSTVVDDAAAGEFVTITRHGKPAAVVVSVEVAEVARKALMAGKPNFGGYLMTFPGEEDLERNTSRMRDVDL